MKANLLCRNPITERTARMFTDLLAEHTTDEQGICQRCQVPNCAPEREARFELVMAGRLTDPLLIS